MNDKQYYIKSSTKKMWIAIIILGIIAFTLSLIGGSSSWATSLVVTAIGIIHLASNKKPLLKFLNEYAEYKISLIGGVTYIKYDDLADVSRNKNKLVLNMINNKKPLTIYLSAFEESYRESIVNAFESAAN